MQSLQNERVHERRNHFVIITSQRTGSTLLVRSLDSSPRIFCAGELFHPGPNILHREFQYGHTILGLRWIAGLVDLLIPGVRITGHLRHFYGSAGTAVEAIGFKLMVSQMRTYPMILPALVRRGVTMFFHFRDDSFATALSYYRAKVSGVFHSDRPKLEIAQPAVAVDEAQFLRFLSKCKSDKEELLRLQRQYGGHLLKYEDMVADWDRFIAGIGAAIGVHELEVSRALSKLEAGIDSVRFVDEEILRERFG